MLNAVLLLGGYALGQNGPIAVVVPTSVNFGQVLVGQTSPQQRITLKNIGNSELTVSSIAISGNFALPKNTCGNGVKPGTHCNVYVTFTPNALETETGSLTFTDNGSNGTTQTVSLTGTGSNNAYTKTTVTASAKKILAGSPITFTATVVSLGGGVIPDGEQVSFTVHERELGYGTLQGGVAILNTTLDVITQPTEKIVAQYVGDQTFYTSAGSVDVLVFKYDTTTSMTSSPNPSVYGQAITFTATATSDGPFPPTGRYWLFLPGLGRRGGPVRVYNHVENVGSFGVGAEYEGDPYNYPSQGGMTQYVDPTTTTTTIQSSKNPSVQGKPVTLKAVVKTPWEIVKIVYGSVTFSSGANTLGTVTLKDSVGSITVSSLPAGQDTITATYTPGNGNFLGSSAALVQTVK